MPRGQPDYGPQAVKEVAASISDMGEVAARLGSIVTYDKRGDVVDFDNFEGTVLKWTLARDAVASFARLDSTYPKSGNQSVYIYTPAVLNAWVQLSKGYALLGAPKLGIELSFHTEVTVGRLELYMLHYGLTETLRASVRLDFDAETLSIQSPAVAWAEIATFKELTPFHYAFHTIKLVADFANSVYERVMLNIAEYDISAHTLHSTLAVVAPYILFVITFRNDLATESEVWVDDFIITQAEP